MKISKDTTLTLLTFFSLVIAFYFLGYWLIYRMAQATPLMLSVGLATLVTCIIRKRTLANLGWQWGDWKYQHLSYALPVGIALTAYIIIWLCGFGSFYNVEFAAELKGKYNLANWNDASIFLFHVLLIASVSFLVSLPSILGEEIGWRGFLVPELNKFMSFTGVALTSGLVWALWHWPLIINGLYGNSSTPLYYQLFFFSLFIVSTGVILTYLRIKSGSVWTAVIYHASSNIFIQKFFTSITEANERSAWYVDEFGAVLAIVVTAVAIYFWRKGINEFDAPVGSR